MIEVLTVSPFVFPQKPSMVHAQVGKLLQVRRHAIIYLQLVAGSLSHWPWKSLCLLAAGRKHGRRVWVRLLGESPMVVKAFCGYVATFRLREAKGPCNVAVDFVGGFYEALAVVWDHRMPFRVLVAVLVNVILMHRVIRWIFTCVRQRY